MPSYVAWTAACLHALYLNVLTAPLALFFRSASSLRPLWDGQSGAASSRSRRCTRSTNRRRLIDSLFLMLMLMLMLWRKCGGATTVYRAQETVRGRREDRPPARERAAGGSVARGERGGVRRRVGQRVRTGCFSCGSFLSGH